MSVLGKSSLPDLLELHRSSSFTATMMVICRKMYGKTEKEINELIPDKEDRKLAKLIMGWVGETAKRDLTDTYKLEGTPIELMKEYNPSLVY